jgi:thymidylate synthase (FAD)
VDNQSANGVDAPTRLEVPAMAEIIGQTFIVLDDGFVRAVDYLGGDHAIVQAARVSFGAGTRRVHEDRGLIRYLMRMRHTTPFEMCELKLHVRVPMDTWRQWIRHRTASVNEYSTRYSIAIDRAQETDFNAWRLQSPSNRQGSAGFVEAEVGKTLSAAERDLQKLSRKIYEERLAVGVAREQARKDLPLSTYTEAYWKIDLHNLLHFLALRLDDHAQAEIRAYARVIANEIVAKWVPDTWEAFLDYHIDAISLSRIETNLIGAFLSGNADAAFGIAQKAGWFEWDPKRERWKPNRERDEFLHKLKTRLGLSTDWATQSREAKR